MYFQVIWSWIIMTLKMSLKVIQTGTIRTLGCGFLFAFHSNYGCIFNRFWDIQRQRMAWPWNWGQGWFNVIENAPFDRSYDFLLVGHCKYICMLYHFQVTWRWIIVTLKRLLKVIQTDTIIWYSWPWNLGLRSLEVIQTGTTRKLRCGFLFAFHINYGRIFNRLWDIQRQRIASPWKLG